MPSRYEMRLPFSTTKEIRDWAKRYTKNQTGVRKLIEKYLMGLKKNRSGTQETQDTRRLSALSRILRSL